MAIFQPQRIIDPRTGKERIVSPEEQELMLMKGVFFKYPLASSNAQDRNEAQPSSSI